MDSRENEIERLLRQPGEIDRLLGLTEADISQGTIHTNRKQQNALPRSPKKHTDGDQPCTTTNKSTITRLIPSLKIFAAITAITIGIVGILTGQFYSQQPNKGETIKATEPTPTVQNQITATIQATQDCWMEIRDFSSNTVFEGILEEGKSLNLSLPEGFEIYPGRPETLLLNVDGVDVTLGNELRWHQFPSKSTNSKS